MPHTRARGESSSGFHPKREWLPVSPSELHSHRAMNFAWVKCHFAQCPAHGCRATIGPCPTQECWTLSPSGVSPHRTMPNTGVLGLNRQAITRTKIDARNRWPAERHGQTSQSPLRSVSFISPSKRSKIAGFETTQSRQIFRAQVSGRAALLIKLERSTTLVQAGLARTGPCTSQERSAHPNVPATDAKPSGL